MENLNQLIELLEALSCSANDRRRQAEVFFNQLLAQNSLLVAQQLLILLGDSSVPVIPRSLAGVLLRSTVERHFKNIPIQNIVEFQEQLIRVWIQETNLNNSNDVHVLKSSKMIVKRLSHTISQMAIVSKWNNLIPTIIQIQRTQETNSSMEQTENSLISLLNLLEILPDYVPEDINSNLTELGSFLGLYVNSNKLIIQVSCARAICSVITCLENENNVNSFRSALVPIMNTLNTCLSEGDEDNGFLVLDRLVEIASVQPLFFKLSVEPLLAAMLSVCASPSGQFEFKTRAIAFELVLTLAETAPALVRKCQAVVLALVPVAFALMIEVEKKVDEWAKIPFGSESELESEEEECLTGEEAIERFAFALGGRLVADEVLRMCEVYSANSNDWRFRRAAVAAVHRLAEGAPAHFEKHFLKNAIVFLQQGLSDACVRVQFQSLACAGRLAALFPEQIELLVRAFVPQLNSSLTRAGCSRVAGQTVAALKNIFACEELSINAINPFLGDLLNNLLALLMSISEVYIKSTILSLVGEIAKVTGDSFRNYYSSFMPGVMIIILQAQDDRKVSNNSLSQQHQRELRARAIECAGLMCEAVFSEDSEDSQPVNVLEYRSDAHTLMGALVNIFECAALNAHTALNGSRADGLECALPACARVARALGAEFLRFAPVVLPALIEGVKEEVHFALTDADEDELEGEVSVDEVTGLQSTVIGFGAGVRKRVTLSTTALANKQSCARVMMDLSVSLGAKLDCFLLPMIESLLPLIVEKHSHDARSAGSLALSKCFAAFLARAIGGTGLGSGLNGGLDAERLPEVLAASLGRLLEALREDVNSTSRACEAEALRDILMSCYKSGTQREDGSYVNPLCKLDLSTSQQLGAELLSLFGKCVERQSTREEEFKQNECVEEEDRLAFAEELEEENESMTFLIDSLGILLRLHGDDFLPFIETHVLSSMRVFLQPNAPTHMHLLAVCLGDDIIEFGGVNALKFVPNLLSVFLNNLRHSDPLVRQSSTYGLAQSLRFAPEQCLPRLNEIVPAMLSRVQEGFGNLESEEGVIENIIYGLGFVFRNSAYKNASWGGVTSHQLAQLWLQKLPLRADEQEAKVSQTQLCDAIEMKDEAVVGVNFSNLTEVLRVIADVLIDESEESGSLSHSTTLERMKSIVRQVASFGEQAFKCLDSSQQQVLLGVL